MSAGDNENLFIQLMIKKFGKNCLDGKKTFEINLERYDKVSISVDESLVINNKTILIEIDSGNMAKLIAGQYTLLNGMYQDNKANTLFLVIHYYKDYNRDRTLKNLNAIQHFNLDDDWIPFNAYNIQEFKNILNDISSLEDLLKKITPCINLEREET